MSFTVKDYTGANTLSTYALDITPLTFVAPLSTTISNKTFYWDFGDGNYSTDISPTHVYRWPGRYKVTLSVLSANGSVYDSSFQPNPSVYDSSTYSSSVSVFDFVPTQTVFRSNTNAASGLIAGSITQPFYIDTLNSWQSYKTLSAAGITLNLYVSGSPSNRTIFDNDKWSHLRPQSRFLIPQLINGIIQYTPISSLTVSQTAIYANVSNNVLQLCGPNDPGSMVVGSSGSSYFYYVGDIPLSGTTVNYALYIFASPDNSKFNDAFTLKQNLYNYVNYPVNGFQNIAPAVQPITRVYPNSAAYLSITTTGIDGEGSLSSTNFNIPYISWQYTQIPYLVKFKDSNNFTVKNYPPLSSTSANLNVPAGGNYNVQTDIIYPVGSSYYRLPGVTFYEDFTTDAPQSLSGFYKGYFVSNTTALNCMLTASVTIQEPGSLARTITGSSTTFNIYSTAGQYNIAKINEDWDAEGFYKSLRYQENLLDKEAFFTDFLGTIVGGISAYPYELGKTVYEKIANFVDNKADIERVNIDSLLSFCNELSIQFEQYTYSYPPQLKRMVDLLSIKQKKLWGDQNTYGYDFNRGTDIPTDITKGKNLGTLISPTTGTITVGVPVVTYEIFSGNYNLVNTVAISGYNLGAIVPLSSYNYNWGWGLVLADLNSTNFSTYYNIYTYIPTVSGDYFNNIINWSDPYTTLTEVQSGYSNWSANNGIVQTLLSYELTKGLQLFTSAVQIALT
jgi:hypothetical protein